MDKNGNKVPLEQHFTTKVDQGHYLSLDYIIEYAPTAVSKNNESYRDRLIPTQGKEKKISVIERSCKTNPMKVKNQIFSHMSDHYAIEATLSIPE